MAQIYTPHNNNDPKKRAEELKRRRAAALADYERRHNPTPTSVDSQFAAVFPDTPSQAADTACSVSDSSGSCGGGE